MWKACIVAQFDEIELRERLLLRGYPFTRYAPAYTNPISQAVTPLRKPLRDCTVALVTTAGLSLSEQPPFDISKKRGDSSFRELPAHISPQILEMNQRSGSFDHTGVLRDRNLAFPL